jgi:hypothetical protein
MASQWTISHSWRSYVVGSKGQIVVAKEIRDRLGVESGWIALQRLVGDHLEVYFVPPEHGQSIKGSLARHLKTRIPAGDWDTIRQNAWETAGRDRTGSAGGPGSAGEERSARLNS